MSGILHNRYLLYAVFIIALADFLYLGSIRDMTSVFVFVLIGLLVSFFNKNMIIVLSSAMIVANVLKYGGINQKIVVEGFQDEDEDEDKTEDKNENEDEDTSKNGKEKEEDTAKKSTKPDKEEPKTKDSKKDSKEEFGQDKEVVYTSVDDMAINQQDKMMLANEKLLERMNKYKPLLDTLQGLTKNMAIMKGIASSANDLKDDIINDTKDEKKSKKE
jgi:flagellar motor protein MotB